jgi:hypothetical protein
LKRTVIIDATADAVTTDIITDITEDAIEGVTELIITSKTRNLLSLPRLTIILKKMKSPRKSSPRTASARDTTDTADIIASGEDNTLRNQ